MQGLPLLIVTGAKDRYIMGVTACVTSRPQSLKSVHVWGTDISCKLTDYYIAGSQYHRALNHCILGGQTSPADSQIATLQDHNATASGSHLQQAAGEHMHDLTKRWSPGQ